MANNRALQRAAKAQQDEFYTSMPDIAEELRHYRAHFRGKKILCNCDDPYESKFFKYFAIFFNDFALAKLTATCYSGSPIAHQQLTLPFYEPETPPQKRTPYAAEITDLKDYNGDTATDYLDIEYMLTHNVGARVWQLQGDGDFRSPECIELLKDADIVVTNPPHSLLREYIALLMEHNKKFIIIGNMNAITYKEIFPLIMSNKMWLGFRSGDMAFRVPDNYEPRETRYWEETEDNGHVQKFRSLGNICWFTNLDIKKRHEFLFLFRSYTEHPEHYPHYDNYDAIEVSKTADIPMDYDGVMGVPITFMDKYNPEQFEILGITQRDSPLKTKIYTREDAPNFGDLNARATIKDSSGKLRST
ncbi:MAG: adenine-specific methyltransferase EcoRI family protein, partial [Synergistaceae bacterium]|nr:adenine-specific methyltransferase EcoRI family protein [Synergistaceae bacterium]